MMKQETDFKVGETCLYHEDGHISRCEILTYKVKDGWLRLSVKVLESIHVSGHRLASPPTAGEVFSVDKLVDLPGDFGGLMWRIEEDPNC